LKAVALPWRWLLVVTIIILLGNTPFESNDARRTTGSNLAVPAVASALDLFGGPDHHAAGAILEARLSPLFSSDFFSHARLAILFGGVTPVPKTVIRAAGFFFSVIGLFFMFFRKSGDSEADLPGRIPIAKPCDVRFVCMSSLLSRRGLSI
jgi:hypothetical protein